MKWSRPQGETIMKARVITFVTLVIMLMLWATPVYGQEVPPLPHAFYGNLTINDSPAPVGTQVEARGEGVSTGIEGNPIVTTAAGSYGSPDPMGSKLIVQGDILDGATLTFYVNGVEAEGVTAEWHSGEVTELDLTVTIVIPPPPPPPAGGAGLPILPPGTTNLVGIIDYRGMFTQTVIAVSFDGLCRLIINKDTIGLTKDGEPLFEISMTEMEAPPAPPEHAHFIGLVYDFGPDGATFSPAATLEYTYDPANIPEGIAEEKLVIAWWDVNASEWVMLDSVVDPEANTITAPVSHFTAFCTLAYTRPAAFTTTGLSISPTEVDINENVTISVSVTNTGDLAGSYEVTLKIDTVVEASKEITVNAGASEKVTFTTVKDVAKTYSVDVNGLSGSFTVKEKPAPPPPPPPPAPPPPLPPPPVVNWSLIWGIIGGVVVVGVIIFLVARKKRRA